MGKQFFFVDVVKSRQKLSSKLDHSVYKIKFLNRKLLSTQVIKKKIINNIMTKKEINNYL